MNAEVVLVCRGAEVASWPLHGACPPDLGLVDRLARVQLMARQLGCSIELRHAGEELAGLLDLVGLGAVLGGGQVVGQAEGGEQAGVEEAVPPRDPSA